MGIDIMATKRPDRTKNGPTPKRKPVKRYRCIPPTLLTAFSSGIRSIPAKRCLDSTAVRDAIDECSYEEAIAIAAANERGLKIWCDIFADRYPSDSRWDGWRAYRQCEVSHAN